MNLTESKDDNGKGENGCLVIILKGGRKMALNEFKKMKVVKF